MTASGAYTHILARSLTPCEVRNNQGGRPSRHGEGCRPPTNKSNKSGLQGRFRFTLTFRKHYGQNRLSTPTLPVFPGILLAEGHSGLLRTRLDGNTVPRQPGKQEGHLVYRDKKLTLHIRRRRWLTPEGKSCTAGTRPSTDALYVRSSRQGMLLQNHSTPR